MTSPEIVDDANDLPENVDDPEDIFNDPDVISVGEVGDVNGDLVSPLAPEYVLQSIVIGTGVVIVILAIGASVYYSVRRGRGEGNWNQSTTDVRFMTSDEILDFTLAQPSNDMDLLLQDDSASL